MTRRIKSPKVPAPEPAPAPAAFDPGADTLRRTLLLLLTGLVVARPLVPGEDPGLTSDLSDAGGPLLVLLTLGAGVAWAGWRLWAGRGELRVGAVEVALLAAVGLLFFSAASASYKRPAWLIAWEWAALALLLFLIRQLVRSADEQHGLFAAVLAGGVALAASGVYQAAVDLPREARRYGEEREDLRASLALRNVTVSEGELDELQQRARERRARATYTDAEAFAGYLALLLPGLVAAFLACLRGEAPQGQTALAGLAALLGAVALWLTGSGTAVLACLAVGGAALALAGRRGPAWLRLGAGAAGGAALGVGLLRLGLLAGPTRATLAAQWGVSWRLIEGHAWRGVGPGNFALIAPRFLPEGVDKFKHPHNWLLEAWAAGGVGVAVALAVAFAAFFWQVGRWWASSASGSQSREASPPGAHAPGAPAPVRWEYYIGGTLGLLLGFVLRAGAVPPEDILSEAIGAGLRAVVWFGAFALYERVRWTDAERVGALAAGVAALLLHLTLQGGLGWPALAGPLWVAVALGLAAVAPAAAGWAGRLALAAPLPVLGALAGGYFVFVFLPTTHSASVTHRALTAGLYFRGQMALPPEERDEGLRGGQGPIQYLQRRVIGPLEEAAKQDPDNVRLRTHLADWYGQLWALNIRGEPGLQSGRQAVLHAMHAQKANPEGFDGYLTEADVRLRIAVRLEAEASYARQEAVRVCAVGVAAAVADPGAAGDRVGQADDLIGGARKLIADARGECRLAADALRRYLPRDPTDPTLRYRVAAALSVAGDEQEGREWARAALRLDQVAPRFRRLTDPQREQARLWTEAAPAS